MRDFILLLAQVFLPERLNPGWLKRVGRPCTLLFAMGVALTAGVVPNAEANYNVTIGTTDTAGAWVGNVWMPSGTGSTVAASEIQSNLAAGPVTISTGTSSDGGTEAGDITVSASIMWGANILTLSAANNITINAQMDVSGTAGLALEYGQSASAAGNTAAYYVNAPVNLASSGSFSTKLGSDGTVVIYTIIDSLGAAGSTTGTDLQGMQGNLAGNYVLGADINASGTATWNSDGSGGYYGFSPVGASGAAKFTGTLEGLGHVIDGLYIHSAWAAPSSGLFGYSSGTIRNLGLTNLNVIGGALNVGSLVGVNSGTIYNVIASGTLSGNTYVGGVVGTNSGVIDRGGSSVTVYAFTDGGGLVGVNLWTGGTIRNSYATGRVFDAHAASDGGIYTENYDIGGLVGNNSGSISTSYASGTIQGGYKVGGLVGDNGGSITDSYSTTTLYSLGSFVHSGPIAGGVAGNNMGTITNAYYLGDLHFWTSTQGYADYLVGGTGTGTCTSCFGYATMIDESTATSWGLGNVSLSAMKQASTFAGWDIDDAGGTAKTWRIYEGQTTPLLRGLLAPLTVTAQNVTKVYDGIPYSGGNGVSYSRSVDTNHQYGTVTYGGTAQGAVDPGTYTITPSGLWSDQQGYDITYASGTLTIVKPSASSGGGSSGGGSSGGGCTINPQAGFDPTLLLLLGAALLYLRRRRHQESACDEAA